jgi:DNA-binding response OmpR family regulator
MKDKGRISTYADLIVDLWGEVFPGSEYSLKVHVRHLRERIEEVPDNPRYILNKPGEGYFLAMP